MAATDSVPFPAPGSYLEVLYDAWRRDPSSVTADWQGYFKRLEEPTAVVTAAGSREIRPTQVSVLQLINAHRYLGNRIARLDPLERHEPPVIPQLTLEHYGLGQQALDEVFDTGSLVGPPRTSLRDILESLRKTYCGTVGLEYMHLSSIDEKRWIQNRFEGSHSTLALDADQQRQLLRQITAAETLERDLHTRFVGQKRFSLEGSESLIPALNEIIQRAGAAGTREIVIGMAHRGRLNVLVNCLGKLPRDLFSEFAGHHSNGDSSGDVKYHQGFSSDIDTPGGPMHLALAFNPSHLEIVNPVVEGSVRARQDRLQDHSGLTVMPILIHGDAAFAAQGVVMETLALSQTRGYSTGGTLHLVINNQIGFTTSDPRDARSTTYCTDIAKIVEAPIFHVNGDDPARVLLVVRAALDYRNTHHRDVVVDLVCYRRLGHNEQDEPMVTQPWMYRKINARPTLRQLYAAELEASGVLTAGQGDALVEAYRQALEHGELPELKLLPHRPDPTAPDWHVYHGARWDRAVDTGVSLERLKRLTQGLTRIPENYQLHPSVRKIIDNRRSMGEEQLPLDWGMGETLAYASLVTEGYGVRLSGQDSGRGTFFHRHAVIHDQNRQRWDAGTYLPLQNLEPDQASFTVIDSILSEAGVLGFEYGYATAQPGQLVLWEAQFGDFANGAQVLIDQFISSGEAKWGRLCGLTLLLPHGYEGQGPEHSSARVERYLQLCAEYNIQVCVPSTPAQIFHLLRRQMIRTLRRPLIVITPKSLLRRKEASSPLADLTQGGFQCVIPEIRAQNEMAVRRVIACSGKIYYDLLQERDARQSQEIALIRIEQLYPFPHEAYGATVRRYPNATEVLWVQEEPGNQGAWHRIQHYLRRPLGAEQRLIDVHRPSSAAPAVGDLATHAAQQKTLIETALSFDSPSSTKEPLR